MAQLQTLSKALDILNLLGRSDDPLSVEEIAGRMELPESTTYRLLQTLEAKDFIKRYSRKKSVWDLISSILHEISMIQWSGI